eukprot:gb/GECH01008390.1/.p1 GENE.gb/GECH01008390.1/~~gb/GECH01008390.1/.p1  ORF type:complete len:414 (+),score=73.68 gb/GECH01008390.1/:1-1242(+)
MLFNSFSKILLILYILSVFSLLLVYGKETQRRSNILRRNGKEYELQNVQVISRHGDRTPLSKLPGDTTTWYCPSNVLSIVHPVPPQNKFPDLSVGRLYELSYIDGEEFLMGNCSGGELTEKGVKEHYDLGSEFRNLYVDKFKLLSSNFNQEEIYIRSTDKRRTRLSAQSQIIGLYPDDNLPKNDRVLRLNVVDEKTEYMYPNHGFCPILSTLQDKITHSPEYIQYMQEHEPLREKLAQVFNVTPDELGTWTSLLDAFTCLQSHNKPIPGKISQHMIDEVYEISGWRMGAFVNNTDFVKYGVGKLVKELINNMEYSFKHPNPKFRLYSGHDTTIGPLLGALGIYNNTWPPYTSHIVLELFKDARKSEYFVRVKYNGKERILPGCSHEFCKFETFKSITSRVIPTNWKQMCKSKS